MLNEDVNDDYDDNNLDGMSVFTPKKAMHPKTHVIGKKTNEDREFEKRVTKAKEALTSHENLVMSCVGRGMSLSSIGRKIGISEQAVSKTWARIRGKLNGI